MDRYIQIGEIGRGSSSRVYLMKDTQAHRLVAIKKCHLSYYRSISKSSDDIFELACREVLVFHGSHSKAKLLKGMNHPNVMRCYDYFIEGNYLHMVMEYMGCGDLNHLVDLFQRSHQYRSDITMTNRLLPETMLLHIFRECVSGLEYIHGRSIVHRDIKPQNLYLSESGGIKIGDLGISVDFSYPAVPTDTVGTVQYMAPEVVRGENADFSADVWSLGCVLYELMWRKPLFTEGSYSRLIIQIAEQSSITPNTLPEIYSYELRKLVCSMLQVSKEYRPTLSQIQSSLNVLEKPQPDTILSFHRFTDRAFFENLLRIHSCSSPAAPIQYDRIVEGLEKDAEFLIRNNSGLLRIYDVIRSL